MSEIKQLTADVQNHYIEGFTRHGDHQIKIPLISHIEGNLWQGGCIDGVSLGKQFQHVISLYPWERYKTGNMLDSFLEVKLYDSSDMPSQFKIEQIADWINLCAESGPTLVHCQAGLNRSSLVAAVALLRKYPERTPEEVITSLRQARSETVLCNRTFESWVLSYRATD
jgi:hypothetical protein